MVQRSKLERVWRIATPMLVKEVTLALFYMVLLIIADEKKIEMYVTQITASAGILSVPFLLRMMRQDKATRVTDAVIEKKTMKVCDYFFLVLISVPFTIVTNFLIALTGLAGQSEAYQEVSQLLYKPSFPIQLLCVGIIIPIVEELIFRGLIFQRLREYHELFGSMLISAIIFGVFHGNIVQGIYGILAGILLAYVYELYGTVKASVTVHVAMNMTACVLNWFAVHS